MRRMLLGSPARTLSTARRPAWARTLPVAALCLWGGWGCSVNPATGERHFDVIGRDQEIAMGAQAAPQFTAEFGGAVTDPTLQAYVRRIGAELSKVTEGDNPTLPWEFTLLNTSEINAFALPGGKIFFTRGLAERLTSEAQMAGVLGHECGHVTARHANSSMERSGLASLIIGGGAAVLTKDASSAQEWQQIGEQVGGVILLKYSRDQESQADALGMRYMNKAGYNPRAQLEVMQVLQAAMAGGRSPEILSTHPYPETRIQRIQAALAGEYAATQTVANRAQIDQQHAAKYAAEFLPRLKALPAPQPPAARGAAPDAKGLNSGTKKPAPTPPAPKKRVMLDAETGRLTLVDLDDPTTWCAHCREEAQKLAAR